MSDLQITGGRLIDPANGVGAVPGFFFTGGAVGGGGTKPEDLFAAKAHYATRQVGQPRGDAPAFRPRQCIARRKSSSAFCRRRRPRRRLKQNR